jgi:predicted dehydrogenase
MAREGLFGRVTMIRNRVAHTHLVQRRARGPTWRSSREGVGGGSFIQLGVHAVHLIQWLLDSEVRRVTAFSGNVAMADIIEGDDTTMAVMELGGGALGLVESGYSTDGCSLALHGTRGLFEEDSAGGFVLRLDAPYQGEVLRCERAGEWVRGGPGDLCGGDRQRLKELRRANDPFHAFVRAVLAGEAPPVPGEIGLRDVRIVEAVHRSAELGRAVEISEIAAAM